MVFGVQVNHFVLRNNAKKMAEGTVLQRLFNAARFFGPTNEFAVQINGSLMYHRRVPIVHCKFVLWEGSAAGGSRPCSFYFDFRFCVVRVRSVSGAGSLRYEDNGIGGFCLRMAILRTFHTNQPISTKTPSKHSFHSKWWYDGNLFHPHTTLHGRYTTTMP